MRGLLIALVLVACIDGPSHPPSEEAPDPNVARCCDWYNPWLRVTEDLDDPQVCLDDLSDVDECRWLDCLGGLVTYKTSWCPP